MVIFAAGSMAKVKSLKDPGVKMSKSDPNPMSRIDLMDSAEDIQAKLRKATTDSVSREITYDPENRQGLANLIDLHAAITNSSVENVIKEIQSNSFSKKDYKDYLATVINDVVQPINSEMKQLLNNRDHLHTVLNSGAQRASEIAESTMEQVRKMMGLS